MTGNVGVNMDPEKKRIQVVSIGGVYAYPGSSGK